MFRWNYSEREAELVLWGESNFDMRHNNHYFAVKVI
jgi:hypothetical protein